MKAVGKKIILIEDDLAMQSMIKEFLEMQGLETEAFRVAREALQRLDKDPNFDLVITDINMPQMNGMEVLERIQKSHAAVPVVMITAFGTDKTENAARQAGAKALLNKPFKLSDLKLVVQNILAKVS